MGRVVRASYPRRGIKGGFLSGGVLTRKTERPRTSEVGGGFCKREEYVRKLGSERVTLKELLGDGTIHEK